MKKSVSLIYKFIATIFFFLFGSTGAKAQSVTVEELKDILSTDSTAVLIDVRNKNEFVGNMKMLPKAKHIPLPVFADSLASLNKFKERNIYIICRSGRRSMIATKQLIENGFNCYNVTGGMTAYRRKY